MLSGSSAAHASGIVQLTLRADVLSAITALFDPSAQRIVWRKLSLAACTVIPAAAPSVNVPKLSADARGIVLSVTDAAISVEDRLVPEMPPAAEIVTLRLPSAP